MYSTGTAQVLSIITAYIYYIYQNTPEKGEGDLFFSLEKSKNANIFKNYLIGLAVLV